MTSIIGAPALQDHWYVVAESDEVTDAPLPVRLLARDLVLWRDGDGRVVAAPDRCPHREAPLSLGMLCDGVLICAYHGWQFGVGGRCLEIPSSGPGATVPPTAHLSTLAVEECYGLVWVCPGRPRGTIPVVAHERDRAFRRINSGVEAWHVAAGRMVDNFMDISHFPWVHTGTFGKGQTPLVPRVELGELDDGWYGYSYEVDANNPDEALATTGSTASVVHRHMSTGFHLPFTVRSTIRYADGLEHILLLCTTPVDDERSLFTFVVWRNDDFSVDAQQVIAFDRAIGEEDRVMLERVPGTLPLGRTELVSVQADRGSVEWRRRLAAMLEDGSDHGHDGDDEHEEGAT